MARLAFLVGLVSCLGMIGCGDDPAPILRPTSDATVTKNDGGGGGVTDSGVDAVVEIDSSTAGCNVGNESPQVELLINEVTDPASDDVVLTQGYKIQCRVQKGSAVDAAELKTSSIKISVIDALGNETTPSVVSEGDSVYSASFDFRESPNGALVFTCEAEDTSDEPKCGKSIKKQLLDLGPVVEILDPSPDSPHAGGMEVRFRVSESPIAMNDPHSAVESVELLVASSTISSLTEMDGLYTATVDFDDPALFANPLNGINTLEVVAKNGRTTRATPNTRQNFVVDSEGPTIVVESHKSGDIVGGTTFLDVKVSDVHSSVDPGRVAFTIQDKVMMDPVGGSAELFRGSFDAKAFPNTVTEVTVTFEAFDQVGNRSTESIALKLDSVAPISSLDPPTVREGKIVSGVLQCSELFDPVGPDSVSDGAVVGTVSEFRARVEDVANSSFGGSGVLTTLAGIDDTEVKLYLTNRTAIPLIVDTDSDGICDGINPALEPGPGVENAATVIDHAPAMPRGTPFYTTMQDFARPEFGACTEPMSAGTPPVAACPVTSPLRRIIASKIVDGRTPTIYVQTPIDMDRCVGDGFDFQARLSEGWACGAMKTADKLGNVGVSEPLRVCFDDGNPANGSHCPAPVGSIVAVGLPQCTDGCTPRRFEDFPRFQLLVPN